MSVPQPGTNTSPAITDISRDRIWRLHLYEALFLTFGNFPWLKKGQVEQILNVIEECSGAFHWPALDVELGIESIRHPERFPHKASNN